jgi:hypothetical protein
LFCVCKEPFFGPRGPRRKPASNGVFDARPLAFALVSLALRNEPSFSLTTQETTAVPFPSLACGLVCLSSVRGR